MKKRKSPRSKTTKHNIKHPNPKVEMAAQLLAELFWRQVRWEQDHRDPGKP